MTAEAASTDIVMVENFPVELKCIIKERGYNAKQVFNVDEMGLFWKKMLSHFYISKEEKTAPGFKAA